MKSIVLLNDLKEWEIRPEGIYEEYKDLLRKDISTFFSDRSLLKEIDCPGCSGRNTTLVFKKMGFDYRECKWCGSLFVSPRSVDAELTAFYRDSDAGKFLRKVILGKTADSRAKKVFSYRTEWLVGLREDYQPQGSTLLDYRTKYPMLLKQLNDTGAFESILSVLPECYGQEDLLPRNIKLQNTEEVGEDIVDMFCVFEVVERIFSPVKLFAKAYRACRKNGLFVITTGTSSGFEYQVLGEHSPNLIPTDRLNLLSLEALARQIERAGFEIVEMSTPGRLDVETVKRAFERNPDIPLDAFWKYVFRNRRENALHSLQEYLQQFQLSSHVRVAAIKR